MTFYVFSRILNLQIHAHIYRSFIRHHKMLGVRIAKRTIEPQKPANPCGTKLCARIFFVNTLHVGASFISLAPTYFISQVYVPQSENLAGSRISAAGFFFGVPIKLQNQIGTEVSLRPLSPGLCIVCRPGFVHIKAKRREKRVMFCEIQREMGNMGRAN